MSVHQCAADSALVGLVRALVLLPAVELEEVVAHRVRGGVAVIVEVVLHVVRVFGDGALQLLLVCLLARVLAARCAEEEDGADEEKHRRDDRAHDDDVPGSAGDKVSFALRINTTESQC